MTHTLGERFAGASMSLRQAGLPGLAGEAQATLGAGESSVRPAGALGVRGSASSSGRGAVTIAFSQRES